MAHVSSGVEAEWDGLRASLRTGGAQRVHQHVTTKLASTFGYGRPLRQHSVSTREGQEDGGWFLQAANGETAACLVNSQRN